MADEPDLQPGDTGAYVTYLKQLVNYGDAAAQLDETNDQYDNALGEALRRFQASRGLPDIGHCDRATWDALLGAGETEATHVEQQDAGTHAATGMVKVHVNDSFDFDGKVLKVWIGGAEQAVAESSQGFDLHIVDKVGGEGYWKGTGLTWPVNDVAAGEWVEYEHSFETNAVPDAGEDYRYRVSMNLGEALETTKEFAFDVGADGNITFH